jgi:CRP/FNR family cyclic AMP-dependent transcriptional regulator
MAMLESSARLPTQAFAAGDIAIAQGQPSGRLLVLVEGSVVVERDGIAFARVSGPGAVFGEMSIVLGRPASATVRCEVDSMFRVAEDGAAWLNASPDVAMDLLRINAARVDALSGYLVDIRRQYAEHGTHLEMLDQVLGSLMHHQTAPSRPGSVRDPEG